MLESVVFQLVYSNWLRVLRIVSRLLVFDNKHALKNAHRASCYLLILIVLQRLVAILRQYVRIR